ncbi:MAG: hypothetical protein I8N66_28785 [Ensifer sp. SSB1]|nr:hypothetical protein [Ensifer sp. SSB1]
MPTNWPGYEVDFRFGAATYCIEVKRGSGRAITLDGEELKDVSVPLVDDGQNHQVVLVVG